MLIGIAGALVGGWLGQTLLGVGTTSFSWAGLLTAIVGAMVLLFLYRLVAGGGSATRRT